MTVTVTGGPAPKVLTAVLPKDVVTATITSLKKMKSVKLRGPICPGAEQNELTASYGETVVKRTATSCSEDPAAKTFFYESQKLLQPILAVIGDRDTMLGNT
jgi:hypothetical protein